MANWLETYYDCLDAEEKLTHALDAMAEEFADSPGTVPIIIGTPIQFVPVGGSKEPDDG